jgi:hypothetical protein
MCSPSPSQSGQVMRILPTMPGASCVLAGRREMVVILDQEQYPGDTDTHMAVGKNYALAFTLSTLAHFLALAASASGMC